METSMDGVFACGNVLHIHDLVDFVTQESTLAGRNAGDYAMGRRRPADNIKLTPGPGIGYCVPHTISTDREQTVYMRVRRPQDRCSITFGDVYEKKLRYAFPAEMITVTMKPAFLQNFHGDSLTVDVQAK
jgi:hypothetical protein